MSSFLPLLSERDKAETLSHSDDDLIGAAPLCLLFRYKSWQKLHKDTWAKLEKGDHGWASLAMDYWRAPVREKCKTGKSLAIEHDLEGLFVESTRNSEGATR